MKTEDKVTTNWSQTGIDPLTLGVRREDDPEAYLRAYRKAYSALKKAELSARAAAKYAEENKEIIEARENRRELREAEKARVAAERRAARELAKPANEARSAASKRARDIVKRKKDRATNPEKNHERRVKKVKWASWAEFKPFYEEAKRLRLYTGQLWDVEHIYPIKSDWVCGLHTPDNLRISSRAENMHKANRPLGTLGDELWDPDHYSVYWPGESLTMSQKRSAKPK